MNTILIAMMVTLSLLVLCALGVQIGGFYPMVGGYHPQIHLLVYRF